jgi:hypothetical protein
MSGLLAWCDNLALLGLACSSSGPVKGLVPEIVEQRLREKVEPAYRFHDEMEGSLFSAPAARESRIRESRKRKKRA